MNMKYRNSIGVAIEVLIEGRVMTINPGKIINVREPLKSYQGILIPVDDKAVDEVVEAFEVVPKTDSTIVEQKEQNNTSEKTFVKLNNGTVDVTTENLKLTRDHKGRLFNPSLSEKEIKEVSKKLDINKDDIKIIIEADVARSRAETKRVNALERKKKRRLEKRLAREESKNEKKEKKEATLEAKLIQGDES
jgi:hypothetical protein